MRAEAIVAEPSELARRNILPGFRSHHGTDAAWLVDHRPDPAAALFLKTFELSFEQFWAIVTSRRALHALQVSLASPLAAALVNLGVRHWSWPGPWCAIAFRAAGCSTRSSICRSRCRPRSPASR